MAAKITMEVTITEVHERRAPDGQIMGHASFAGKGNGFYGLHEISGTLPLANLVASLGGVHVGRVLRMTIEYQPDQQAQEADKE